MKSIDVTDKMYNQLESMAIEQDEFLEVVTCFYLEIGIRETYRVVAGDEFYKLAKKYPHLVGHC